MITKDNDIESINMRLDAIIRILLTQPKIQEANLKEKIHDFVDLGFDNNEIARILETKASHVAKERSLSKVKKNG